MEEVAAARDAAEAASNAKSRFLAHMSHELRTPLNAIIGFSQVMRDEKLGPGLERRRHEYAADIHSSGVTLLNMIDDILELTRLDSGSTRLREEDIAPWTLVEESLRSLHKQGRQRIICDPGSAPESCLIHADRHLLSRCLRRLVQNALAVSGDAEKVRVEATIGASGEVRFCVVDQGPGIDPSDMAILTEPFGRASSSSLAGERPGLGLGLALANMEVNLHGGQLTIDSEPGKGTTATIILPPDRTIFMSGRTDTPVPTD